MDSRIYAIIGIILCLLVCAVCSYFIFANHEKSLGTTTTKATTITQ